MEDRRDRPGRVKLIRSATAPQLGELFPIVTSDALR